MMSKEQNDLITRVGADAPAGRLLRQYWQPVALVDEFEGARPVRAVRLMGQDFVVFRDERGQYGMLDRDCPHRGADLSFGRLEDGGLRCPFHGWLFDRNGTCLQTPAEPAGSKLCSRIRQNAYPVVERSGMLFAFIGEGEPPAFPAFDCFVAPSEYTFAFKGLLECNWLQALEVGIDPAHASFLHRFFEDEDTAESYGKQFRGASADSAMPITKVLREFDCPDISLASTGYGMRLTALRDLGEGQQHVRVTNVVFPQAFIIPMSAEMTIAQWHVPIDDTSCYWYAIFTSFTEPVNKQQMRDQRLALYELPDYRPRQNKHNRYGFNPYEQRTRTYTGMGNDINVHDQWAVESQGAIQDRTREHLGTTDKGIIAYRKQLVAAIEANERGEKALMMVDAAQAGALTGPPSIDGVSVGSMAPDDYWSSADAKRRAESQWASRA
ncbi:aromatic ring-hydroxylating dioxygenase subunit alpha [Cupriavidus oxalaticus]|uniref:Dioxygenase n=1 Tax=Cupriavidus oxalaticus TaxID=96344 RepID=A0A375FIV8_9BURK|nr:aromatic ring-hydroxylating dioxygenase subunit alpha [Cupriavidus oxalaticus]QRQ84250.1 aromatic ring-hydroxylating dioxygenase subunit alpha [Cupriavidus oxalaticus]QRQ91663.1 aromatic ring-hydroxylating dioxygenase subunit alpha [Cupriavidus oxalaticus]WQD86245.1 aromatic ring-hydroxylating dioxygenase subunit alpha [Cupriavidus oxalaticus]SPC05164.1 Dioxygenase [Cupriavidus oxalaticus]SPC18050.1 Dioxygenase [Cupriavidus oxalaticus]